MAEMIKEVTVAIQTSTEEVANKILHRTAETSTDSRIFLGLGGREFRCSHGEGRTWDVAPFVQAAKGVLHLLQQPGRAVARGQVDDVADERRRVLDLAGSEMSRTETECSEGPIADEVARWLS